MALRIRKMSRGCRVEGQVCAGSPGLVLLLPWVVMRMSRRARAVVRACTVLAPQSSDRFGGRSRSEPAAFNDRYAWALSFRHWPANDSDQAEAASRHRDDPGSASSPAPAFEAGPALAGPPPSPPAPPGPRAI